MFECGRPVEVSICAPVSDWARSCERAFLCVCGHVGVFFERVCVGALILCECFPFLKKTKNAIFVRVPLRVCLCICKT